MITTQLEDIILHLTSTKQHLEVVAAIKPGGINKEALRNTTLLCLGKASGRRGPGGVVLEN